MTEDYQPLLAWVEQQLGGRVVRNERQGERRSGGRPAFFIDVETPDGLVRTYARMSRGPTQSPFFTLEREQAVLEELHGAGIAVPEPLGLCPDPEGLLLECLAGEDDYCAIDDDAQRDAIDRAFVSELAKVHAIDAERFAARGLALPRSAEDFALGDLAMWEKGFDRGARAPVPLVTFARLWLYANVPAAPERAVLVQGDTGPGQFLFDGDRLCGIVDWEFAQLGDPLLDLAHIRTRDFYNPGADIPKWFRLYEEFSGTKIDATRLAYYTVKAMLITPLALAPVVQHMHPGTDHMEWYAQDATYKRATVEALAEAIGIELEPAPPIPQSSSEHSEIFEILEQNLREEQLPALELQDDAYLGYRMRLTLRLLAYARNLEAIGPEVRAAELDDMGGLLGKLPASRAEGHAAIDAWVRADAKQLEKPGKRREALVRYFHRHTLREESLMRGGLGVGEHAVHQRLS
jgi:aminoglycoside phosphotransferase (APT) family kinase protein